MPSLTVQELERWAQFGAIWRVSEIGERHAVVDLCQCTGQLEARHVVTDPVVLAYLRAHPGSDD
jgi:hypothetical protein